MKKIDEIERQVKILQSRLFLKNRQLKSLREELRKIKESVKRLPLSLQQIYEAETGSVGA